VSGSEPLELWRIQSNGNRTGSESTAADLDADPDPARDGVPICRQLEVHYLVDRGGQAVRPHRSGH